MIQIIEGIAADVGGEVRYDYSGRVVVTVLEIDRGKIRLGTKAPKEIVIDREEVRREKLQKAAGDAHD